MNAENQCLFVSSRGILNSCDVRSMTPKSSVINLGNYNFENLKDGCSIYVCATALKHFLKIIPKISCKFVLVTGDCDEDFTDVLTYLEYNLLINNENMIHWFSQNCMISNEKMSAIPIGLDYHTISSNIFHKWGKHKTPLEQEAELLELRKNSEPFYNRIIKAYSNFHFSTKTKYGKERTTAMHEIPSHLVFYETTFLSRIETWKNQMQYAFIISPPGNGYDCHRTWEALCLGCIPIVKKNPINEVFEDLPVLIVNNWNDITKELLENTIIEFKTKTFNYDKLLLSYWINKIKNHPKK